MLSFTEQLKELVFDVETSGGKTIQKTSPSNKLILELKGFTVKKLREQPEPLSRNVEYFLMEEFNEGFLEEGIRVCLIHLGEMGITDSEEVSSILHKVIEKRIRMLLQNDRRSRYSDKISIDDAIIRSLINVWEEYGSEITILYSFAKQRFLIRWNYKKQCWQPTGIGKFLLELTPLQAVILFLTIDLVFNIGEHDSRHMSATLLRSSLELDGYDQNHFEGDANPLHTLTLQRLGVLRTSRNGEYKLTPLGKIAIEAAIAEENPMREAVKVLVENEERGIRFEGSDRELRLLRKQLTSEVVEEKTRKSIENAISLYNSGSYADSSKIFFPAIESVASKMLLLAGEDPTNRKLFPGLTRRLEKLEELKLIPSDLASSIDLAYARNKVLHGQYEPLEQEYSLPLCIAAIIYLRRMLHEFEKVKGKTKNK